MKRLLAVLTLTAVAALTPSSASASVGNTDMQICNAQTSKSWIWPRDVGETRLITGTQLEQGQCGTYHNNLGQLRVYIPSQSYRYGTSGQGYGACKNSPWNSDPPNSANGTSQTYHAYAYDNCS